MSVEIQFKLTSIGKTDIANLLAYKLEFNGTSGNVYKVLPSTNLYADLGDRNHRFGNLYADNLSGCIPTNTATGTTASEFPKGSIFLAIIEVLDLANNPVDVNSGFYCDLTTAYAYNNRSVNVYEAISCNENEQGTPNRFKKGRNLTNLRLGFKFLCGLSATDYMDAQDTFLVLVMVY